MESAHLRQLMLFPLPNAVFFPDTLLPLHIFENRYRAMVQDAIEDGLPIAVAMLKPGFESSYDGQPEIHTLAGAGQIIHWEELPDGRFNIILKGEGRVRIVHEHPLSESGYRSAKTELIEDRVANPDSLRQAMETLESLTFGLTASQPSISSMLLKLINHLKDPGQLSNNILSVLLPTPEERQAALGQTSVENRLELINACLTDLMLTEAKKNDTKNLN